MANYIIGIDFGTYQTKVCVNHLDANPQQHEFFEFQNGKQKSFFLPSRVFYLENNTFQYGVYDGSDVRDSFNYFKIASAEDERFNLVSDIKRPVYTYGGGFGEFAPEFLSLLYVTYVLLNVKGYFNSPDNQSQAGRKGLFSRLRRITEVENTFSVRLGIPTEYSKKINLLRRRKFETILLISEMIQEEVNYSIEKYRNFTKNELIALTTSILERLTNPDTNFELLMNEKYRITVYPESAAGLLYFAKSGKLDTGVYASIDIGGGTSDISFFNVQPDKKIMYLASESFLTACNNIYIDYHGGSSLTLREISETERELIELIQKKDWTNDRKYVRTVQGVKLAIEGRLKFLFSNAVFGNLGYISNAKVRHAFKGQPCLIYGGGILHPWIKNWQGIMVYDSGTTASLVNNNYTYMDTKNVNAYIPDTSIIRNKNWEEYFSMLIVAFGLSYLHHRDHNYWDDHDYRSIKIKEILEEVPHPRNEGMYIYNVLEKKWIV